MIKEFLRRAGIVVAWLWTALFVAVAFDLGMDSSTAVADRIIEVVIALVCAVFPLLLLRSMRRRRNLSVIQDESVVDRLTGSDRDEYERLLDAHVEVRRLVGRGIVPAAALDDVTDRIEHLGVLLQADAESSRLGGRLSAHLRTSMRELTAGLVALIDLAVDRETAALGAPVSLHEALETLEAHLAAEDELRDLT